MVIKRDSYLQKIYSKKGNGKVKIITGIPLSICDRISGTSDYGLGCPRLEKGYLVRIALFSFYFLWITFKYNDPESVKTRRSFMKEKSCPVLKG